MTTRPRIDWRLRTRALPLGGLTRVVGIVNVTPDSFSDGGRFPSPAAAVRHALRLLDEGADILDIGGESTRPGSPAHTAQSISAADEQARVLPVIDGILLARPAAILSIDTYRAGTARLAVEAGAEIVNDVSGGLWDEAMFSTCAALRCGLVVMHTRGLPSEWDRQPRLQETDVLPTVLGGLRERLAAAVRAGVERDRIVLDPGFGFGKRGAENWTLLREFHRLHELKQPLLAGLSRKGFLSAAGSHEAAEQRDDLTLAANVLAIAGGAHLVRVHDVRGSVRSNAVADMALGDSNPAPSS